MLKNTTFILIIQLLFFYILLYYFNIVECSGEEVIFNIPQAECVCPVTNTDPNNIPVYTSTGQLLAIPEIPINLVEGANSIPQQQEPPLLQENNKCIWCLICCGCIPY